MNKKSRLLVILGVVLIASMSFGQTAINQTTLTNAMGVGPAGLASGDTTAFTTVATLGSATGVTTAVNGAPVTILYVDQEAMSVLSLVPGTTLSFNVLRGQFGTKAHSHVAATMVLLGVISPQFGGFSGSGGLQISDPPLNGACTAANTGQTPWVNMLTRAQWLCSTVTKTWVPGFYNPYTSGAEEVTAAVASAAGLITPSGPLFHITGALAITGFNIPIGFNASANGGGQICVIPDAIFTTTTANNIALASTAVVNKILCWSWDATNSKFVPTY